MAMVCCKRQERHLARAAEVQLHLIETRPQLSQIEPRDLCLMHVMLCAEVNAQCDKLVKVSKVVGETKLTTVATVDVSQRNLN